MIYLWTDGARWEAFEVDNTPELETRNISIGDRAIIGNRARIGYDAIIGNRARPKIIYIIGSEHPVSYWSEDRIDVGCESHSIADWIENADSIGNANDYTDEQIQEYLGYVQFIKSVHDKG